MRRAITIIAAFFLFLVGIAPTVSATPRQFDECSAQLYHNDARLGPEWLPYFGPVGRQLVGYDRTGGMPDTEFLNVFSTGQGWRYPPQDGYVIDQHGNPIRREYTLAFGQRIDRYGSVYGSFLAPEGSPYASRSIPPQNLVSAAAPATCNYHDYLVIREFDVWAGPIAPWFNQPGRGIQFQLNPDFLPGATNVLWLLNNGYLREL
jgi:hypothetical protein